MPYSVATASPLAARAVHDVDDLDVIDLAKAGNVSQALIAARPDQADSEGHVYS